MYFMTSLPFSYAVFSSKMVSGFLLSWNDFTYGLGGFLMFRVYRLSFMTVFVLFFSLVGVMTDCNGGNQSIVSGNLLHMKRKRLQEEFVGNGGDVSNLSNEKLLPLQLAIINGEVDVVKFLLKHGADAGFVAKSPESSKEKPDSVDTKAGIFGGKMIPLHLATILGRENIVEILSSGGVTSLEKKVDVNAKDNNGRTALHKAIWYGYKVIVEKLLSEGAHTNVPSKSGRMPLDEICRPAEGGIIPLESESSCSRNHSVSVDQGRSDDKFFVEDKTVIEIVNLFLDRKIDLLQVASGTTLCYIARCAARSGAKNVLEHLINSSGTKGPCKIDDRDDGGLTLLHEASRYGQSEIVEFLLAQPAAGIIPSKDKKDSGDFVNLRDKLGRTALLLAVKFCDNDKVLNVLLANGADADLPDYEGNTPFAEAVRLSKIVTMNMLLKKRSEEKRKVLVNRPMSCLFLKDFLTVVGIIPNPDSLRLTKNVVEASRSRNHSEVGLLL